MRRLSWNFYLLTALSLSIGWGIRGQFGFEYGAAMAGSLGCLAMVVASAREDWYRRAAHFAMLGGMGWAFGGSMSYMVVVGYTHSPDRGTVLYGFAAMFLLGFLWAAPGGAGCALPAFLDREQLTEMVPAITAAVIGWLLRDIISGFVPVLQTAAAGVTLPAVALLVLARIRRRFDLGTRLGLYICGGWWAGLILLVRICGLHLSPPRPDGWAGCVGLVAGILIFCARNRLPGVAFASVCTGVLGGCGFALAACLKELGIRTGLATNWHSIMEQTDGLMFGLALAVAMAMIASRAPRVSDDPPVRRWADAYAVFFVLWLFTYLNFRKSPAEWVAEIPTLHPRLYGIAVEGGFIPAQGFLGWFDLAYLALGAALLVMLVLHLRRGLPFVPSSWLGRVQLLYLVYLWMQVVINFANTLPRFGPQRLVTEWFMTINAAVCTVLAVTVKLPEPVPSDVAAANKASYAPWIRNMVVFGLLGAAVIVFAGWGVKLALFKNAHVPYGGLHIRFGPGNTNSRE